MGAMYRQLNSQGPPLLHPSPPLFVSCRRMPSWVPMEDVFPRMGHCEKFQRRFNGKKKQNNEM